jgi:hypothetical protein
MGKRELLLIIGFVVAGTLVYQATAPPSTPGAKSFSFSTIVDHIRREVRGYRSNAEVTTPTTYPLKPGTTEVRVAINAESLTITGEDRADILSELRVRSNGFDDAEAQRLAKAVRLEVTEVGGSTAFTILYPREGRQRANIVLKVPAQLRVQVARYAGRLTVSGASTLELMETRGELTIRDIPGRVTATHRGGDVTIGDVGGVKLTFRNADVRLNKVRGDLAIQSQGGEVRASELGGGVELEVNGTDVTFEQLDKLKGPIRLNAVGGSVTLRGVRTDARLDGRNTEIDVTMEQAAPLAIYNDGDEPIELTPPPNGFQMDLLATSGGRISFPDGLLETKAGDSEQRATGTVRGGGPTITLRANHGNITIRSRSHAEEKKAEKDPGENKAEKEEKKDPRSR